MSKDEADSELGRNERGTLAFRVERHEGEYRIVSTESRRQPSTDNLALARLRQEPENKYDPNAIAVTRPGSKHIYGYVMLVDSPNDSGGEFVGVGMGRAGTTIAIMPAEVAEELDL